MSGLLLGLLLVQVFLWGTAFPMIQIGLGGLSAPHLTLFRHLVASLTFVPLLLAFGARLHPRRADLTYFLLLGVLGYTVYHLALNFGQLHVSAGGASLIIATAPAITAVLAYFMIGDRLGTLGFIGSAVAFLGVVLIVLGDVGVAGSAAAGLPAGAGASEAEGVGGANGLVFNAYAWLIVLAAVATSLYAILQRPMFKRYKPIEVAAYATWAGTLPMLVFLPGLGGDLIAAGSAPVWAGVYIGIFPSAVAYTIFSFALSRLPVTVVTAMLYLVPVFALLASWLLVGEVPGMITVVGGAVAIGGLLLLNYGKQRQAKRAALAQVGAPRV